MSAPERIYAQPRTRKWQDSGKWYTSVPLGPWAEYIRFADHEAALREARDRALEEAADAIEAEIHDLSEPGEYGLGVWAAKEKALDTVISLKSTTEGQTEP